MSNPVAKSRRRRKNESPNRAVTYYRNMWPCQSQLLAPLTQLTGKPKFEWTLQCKAAFQQMKSIFSADVILAYPNHNLPCHVYTNASDYQLGATIIQNGRPVAYWSKKISLGQCSSVPNLPSSVITKTSPFVYLIHNDGAFS